ncbi:MAG: MobC family plasmid mobilization relaxosome protein [Lachnospiraceae bacterium]|nr:MobC family plasmid mobilization relaxosome protein [Lachnospiraceae bacterium]
MNKSIPKRKRNRSVTIRMTDHEYCTLKNKVTASGLSMQTFVNASISGSTITSSDELAVEKAISQNLYDLLRQLRGMATNINQMAHVANGQGILPIQSQLNSIYEEINNYRKDSESIWQSIRRSISHQKPMEG